MFTEPSLIIVVTTINIDNNNNIGGAQASVGYLRIQHYALAWSPSLTCKSHDRGQIMLWSDCLKTKGNVNIKLRDLCGTLNVYILLRIF